MFLFRVLKLPQPQEANTIEIYREKAESGDAVAQVQLVPYEFSLDQNGEDWVSVRRRALG